MGGRARDSLTLTLFREQASRQQPLIRLLTSPDALFAGAFGAALLAGRRYQKLARALVRPGVLRGGAVVGRFN